MNKSTTTTVKQTPIATVTDKETGLAYECFEFAGKTASYVIYVHNGKVRHCTCKDRKFHPGKYCKHMLAFQGMLDGSIEVQKSDRESLPLNGSRERKLEQAPSGVLVPMR